MLQHQRSAFNIPKDITFLNCAYLGPLPKRVEAVGIKAMQRKRNPTLIGPNDFFNESDKLRKEFAKLLNTTEDKRIVIIPSASYGIANAANNIRMGAGDEVIVIGEEFPSNFYPWAKRCEESGAKLKTVSAPDTLERRGAKWNERVLEAITSSTKVVALGNVHWADGTLFDLVEIRKRTKDVGAALVIDGSQSIGALPFDIQKIQPDALVSVGYKWMLGPYSIGLAYYGPMFDNGKPIENSWMNRLNAEDFRALVNYQPQYKDGSMRYEVGEHANFVYVPMLIESLKLINKWKPANIQKYCRSITKDAIGELRANGYWIEDENSRGQHLFGIRFPEHVDVEKVIAKFKKNKVYVSFRGNAMRVAVNVFNSERDVEKLASLLLSFK
ncbi:MAG TPA: aminotransferase class V-fold PLP-dependent enzyme [Cyclobacteriaceae bacterium]|nr:aminotransferase class V-fold PLP-dependent enzyme [Cyclobacteriaceae bacterium]